MKDIDHKLSREIVNTHPIRNELVSHQYWQATKESPVFRHGVSKQKPRKINSLVF